MVLSALFTVIHVGMLCLLMFDRCVCWWSQCMFVQRSELNGLQKKSSDDLWKEDLAVFIDELDVSSVFVAFFFVSLPNTAQCHSWANVFSGVIQKTNSLQCTWR